MIKGIYHSLTERKQQHKKSFAVLIDPDKVNDSNLEQLIELLKTVTDYKPNETELQITSLHALLADLKDANNGLGSLLAAAMTARNTRDNTLYLADRGIVDVVLKCKDYVKGLYGSKSAEYKMVSSLKFTRPKKTELINIAA